MRGNFEGTRNRVIDGCSQGGGRRLCKEDVGWIVDLNNYLASWSQRSDMVGRSARKMAFATAYRVHKCNDVDDPLLNGFYLV